MATEANARLGHGQHDLEERAPFAGTVNLRRFGDFVRQSLEEGEEEEHGERQRERHVDNDQAGQRVQQADVLQDEEQGHDGQEDRERQAGEHQVVDGPRAGEDEAGQHVGTHGTQHHDDDQREAHHDHRVEEVRCRCRPCSRR